VAGDGPAEGIEDDGEPDLELVAEVVAGLEDVLGRDLGQVGVLTGELLRERFGGLGDGLRAEGQSGLLERKSVDVAVQQGIGVGGHGHGEACGAQGAEGRIVVAQRRRAGIGSRLHQPDRPGMASQCMAGRVGPEAHLRPPVAAGHR
jgi:hypothetical protein